MLVFACTPSFSRLFIHAQHTHTRSHPPVFFFFQYHHAGISSSIRSTNAGLGVVVLKDTAAAGTALPEGVVLRGIRPPNGSGGSEVDATAVPEAKPPKAFVWTVGEYM